MGAVDSGAADEDEEESNFNLGADDVVAAVQRATAALGKAPAH